MTEPVPTKELWIRSILRLRATLTEVERLAEVIGVNDELPAEVDQAMDVLHDFAVHLRHSTSRRWRPPKR